MTKLTAIAADPEEQPEWPYSPTKGQCEAMGPAALEWWWARYNKYWRGYEGHSNKPPRMDRDDDHDPTLREWGLGQSRIGD